MHMITNSFHKMLTTIKSEGRTNVFVRNLIKLGLNNYDLLKDKGKCKKERNRRNSCDYLETEIANFVNKNNEKVWDWLFKLHVEGLSVEPLFKQDVHGNTALTNVIMDGLENAANWLISNVKNCDLLDIFNDDMHTALHLAVIAGSVSITRTLVIAGADTISRTEEGNTPLHLACIYNDLDCLQALTLPFTLHERQDLHKSLKDRQGPRVDYDLKNYSGRTCLHIASANGNAQIVHYLLAAGANASETEGLDGHTALHMAAESGYGDVVHVLASFDRCHLDALNYAGSTAYQIALDCQNFDVASYLEALGAHTDFLDRC